MVITTHHIPTSARSDVDVQVCHSEGWTPELSSLNSLALPLPVMESSRERACVKPGARAVTSVRKQAFYTTGHQHFMGRFWWSEEQRRRKKKWKKIAATASEVNLKYHLASDNPSLRSHVYVELEGMQVERANTRTEPTDKTLGQGEYG